MPISTIMVKRVIFSVLIGIAISAVFSELAYVLFRETNRPPKTIELTIPAGTADSVAQGQQPPSLPANMDFVVGDVLLVKNQDAVGHQLGPLWIPPGTSAELKIAQQGQLAYECSFQTSKYLGLDVQEALTPGTRVSGILFAGLPLGILIALYSIIMPTRKKEAV